MPYKPNIRAALRKAQKFIYRVIQRLQEKNVFTKIRISSQWAWNLFLVFIVLCLVGIFFVIGTGTGYFAALVKDQPVMSHEQMKKDIYNYTETSDIYLKNNKYIGEMPTSLIREEIDLNNISDHVKKALIATEDRYFYKHEGVVPKAVMRSLFQKVTNAPTVTGGSTLTQQLVKSQILTPEVSFKRKAKEMLYAMRIERFFDKNQILNAYLNVVPFGRNASGDNIAGIQAAAEGVFGVDADKLNIPQAAYLVGMPKNPFSYTPFKNSGGVKKNLSQGLGRMKTVLSRMKENQFITKKQYQKALDYNIKKHLRKPRQSPDENYPDLTLEIKKRAQQIIAKQLADNEGKNGDKLAKNAHLYEKLQFEQSHGNVSVSENLKNSADQLKKDAKQFERFFNIADKKVARNGYDIHTTIDKKLYDKMQKVTKNYNNWAPKSEFCYKTKDGEKCLKDEDGNKKIYRQQLGSVLIKNDTGAILSFVPNRDHSSLNYATQTKRSNGSTMKPLAVYAPAMEMGITQPGATVADLPLKIEGGQKQNFGKTYHGLESTRKALYKSHNIPALRTYMQAMNQGKPREYLRKMGITSLVGHDRPSMGIGGTAEGITVEENTNAFSTFANKGKAIDAYMIEKIVDKEGDVIYKHETKPNRVFSKQTNYLMLDMMRDVLTRGTAAGLPARLQFDSDWAGKTGTSQDVTDEWFVATNPNVTLGLWTGYPQQIGMNYDRAANRTQDLWAKMANAAHEVRPKLMAPDSRFHMPTGIVKRSVCKISGKLPSDLCKKAGLTRSDLFNEKYVPTEEDNALVNKGDYFSLKKNYIDDHYRTATNEDFYQYLPNSWDHFVPIDELEDKVDSSKDEEKDDKKDKNDNSDNDEDNESSNDDSSNNDSNQKENDNSGNENHNDEGNHQDNNESSDNGSSGDQDSSGNGDHSGSGSSSDQSGSAGGDDSGGGNSSDQGSSGSGNDSDGANPGDQKDSSGKDEKKK